MLKRGGGISAARRATKSRGSRATSLRELGLNCSRYRATDTIVDLILASPTSARLEIVDLSDVFVSSIDRPRITARFAERGIRLVLSDSVARCLVLGPLIRSDASMTILRRHTSFVAVSSLSLALLAGCAKDAGETVSAEECRGVSERLTHLEMELEKKDREAAAKRGVELPPTPDFESDRPPVKWEDDPDGAYSIYGLRKHMDERLREGNSGQTIVVKGWVQEIYVPPTCAEGELCPPAKQSHFWLTDSPDETGKKRALMVVNYEFPIPDWDTATQKLWQDQPRINLEVGKQYTIKGKFKRFSDTGFAHDNGLLEFHSYKAPNPDPKSNGEMIWIYPPNSHWHPLAIAKQEAENAAMQERMREQAEALRKKSGG